MRIESGFSLIDSAITAMQEQAERVSNSTSGVANIKTAVPEIVGTENDRGAEAGFGSPGNCIDLNNLSVQITNLDIAVQTYKANIGVLERYRQMTETKLELLG